MVRRKDSRQKRPFSAGPARFGLLCLLAYGAIAWAVRFDRRGGPQIASIVYPFDTFSMYAHQTWGQVRTLLLRDKQGGVHRITAFSAFHCERPPTLQNSQCKEQGSIPYLDDDILQYMRVHPGEGAQSMQLILRTWSISAGAAPKWQSDCSVMTCRVSR